LRFGNWLYRVDDTGLEQPPPESLEISANHPSERAPGRARHAPGDILADAEADFQTSTEAAPGFVAGPLLIRFLAAWNRLSGPDRLRLVGEAERLGDAI
jgi:hypothetical protein